MTPAQLTKWGERIYGAEWKRPMARDLKVRERYIYRWMNGERPWPPWLDEARMLQLAAKRAEKLEKELYRMSAIVEGDGQ